jgi:hypothetical protein
VAFVRDQQVIHIPALLHSADMKAAFDMPNAMGFWCAGNMFFFFLLFSFQKSGFWLAKS